MAAIVPLGTLLGYGLGNSLAVWLLDDTNSLDVRLLALTFFMAMFIGVAVSYFFYSRERLAASLAQAEQAERMAVEQRLQLLASQLEPHMLFNTLANLRALIGVNPQRAQAMLDRLIVFLRATLDASRAATHPLATEFARIADYLELMQIRMGSRLQTCLLLPDGLAALPVPALLLQPLVENAIKHGLEPHVQGGRIELSAERVGAELLLRVRDTGVGIAPEVASNGFGLTQVRERLATLYGAAASVELAPAADAEGGTLVTMRLPL
jgi:LytS/YehU family sensor histidine kinase